jgi:S1-C subfamily serine protease
LRPGDIITAIERRAATGSDSLFLATLTKQPGDRVAVEHTRAGTAERTTIILGSPP